MSARTTATLLRAGLLAGLSTVGAVQATSLPARDPMQPVPGAAPRDAVAASAPAAAHPPVPAWKPRQIVAVEGCRFVVERGRRYGVGETIAGARIVAIDEASVTLREADGVQRRLALHGSAVKRESQPLAAPVEPSSIRPAAARAARSNAVPRPTPVAVTAATPAAAADCSAPARAGPNANPARTGTRS